MLAVCASTGPLEFELHDVVMLGGCWFNWGPALALNVLRIASVEKDRFFVVERCFESLSAGHLLLAQRPSIFDQRPLVGLRPLRTAMLHLGSHQANEAPSLRRANTLAASR